RSSPTKRSLRATICWMSEVFSAIQYVEFYHRIKDSHEIRFQETVFHPVCPPSNSFLDGFGYKYRQIRRISRPPRSLRKLKMKKLILALTAIAAFSGSALAADLPARTYSKAPMMPEPIQNWTGFYLFGGFGYGLWEADTLTV